MAPARVSLLLLLVGSAGCVSVRPVHDPATFIAQSSPGIVYVTHKNGAILTISQPRVSGDTLLGVWQGVAAPLALPLSDLRRVVATQRDKTRTRLLAAGVSVVTLGIGYLITRRTGSRRQPCSFENGTQWQGCDVFRPPDGEG